MRIPLRLLPLALLLVASACTGSDDDATAPDDATPEATADDGSSDPTAADDDDGLTVETGDAAFACGPIDDLGAALATASTATDADLAATGRELGAAGDWYRIETPDGVVLVDATPLSSDPPAYVLVTEAGAPEPCVDPNAVAAGAALDGVACNALSDLEAVVVQWSPVPLGVAADLGRDGSSLYDFNGSDTPRAVVQQAYLTRLASYGDATVDGAVAEATVPGGSYVDLAAPAGAVAAYTLELTADDGTARSVDCGEAAPLDEPPPPTCTVELVAGVPVVTVDPLVAGATLSRNGEAVDVALDAGGGTVRDVDAPPESSTYEYRIEFVGFDPVSATCGTVTPDPTAAAAVASGFDSAELAEAAQRFDDSYLGPYGYATIEPICPDCSGSYEVAFGAGDDGRILGRLLTSTSSAVDEFLIGPGSLYTLLDAAGQQGAEVTWELDPVTGLVTRWTIDGTGAAVRCYEVDTQPPDGRAGCSGGPLVGS